MPNKLNKLNKLSNYDLLKVKQTYLSQNQILLQSNGKITYKTRMYTMYGKFSKLHPSHKLFTIYSTQSNIDRRINCLLTYGNL